MTHRINRKPIEFVVFDLDGVLADTISSWVFIHDRFGVNNDPAYFAYMNNEIDDLEFMRRDITLWLNHKNKFHINEIMQYLDAIPLMTGFQDTMDDLNSRGITSAIVSAGLEGLANRVAVRGRIDHVYANGLMTDSEGYLTGEGILRVKLRDKGKVVKELRTSLGLNVECMAAVGNGEIDIPMFKESGLGIAFNPHDERVVENADVVIIKKDLREILKYL